MNTVQNASYMTAMVDMLWNWPEVRMAIYIAVPLYSGLIAFGLTTGAFMWAGAYQ